MSWKGLERNKLDYILTDLLPVEMSELVSFASLYNYLLEKPQQTIIKDILKQINVDKSKGKAKVFDSCWSTMPLKYNIIKTTESMREMSIIQPFSAINLYLFIECYQKEILEYLRKNHDFSIRYQKKNTDLYYKGYKDSYVEYFGKQAKKEGKAIIQQLGCYYKISPFESMNSFVDSAKWVIANFKYKHYAKIDYKACFDSIYSHSYVWIIERNVIDAKDANNSHLFITIDRLLQNINGKNSNGIVVGPEFSRMIAELLLERIDSEVQIALAKHGLKAQRD